MFYYAVLPTGCAKKCSFIIMILCTCAPFDLDKSVLSNYVMYKWSQFGVMQLRMRMRMDEK